MQQLQSLYRGDSSPSLAQIFGIQYQPQQAISQAANTAVGSGMSAGAQVKTTAMNNATQMAIADANRQQTNRHFTLSHALQNRQQSEVERNNMATNEYNAGMLANNTATTKWNAGGQMAAVTAQDDNAAAGELASLNTQIDTMIGQLSPNDPNYQGKKEALLRRKKAINDGFNSAKPGQRSAYVKSMMGILNPEKNRTGVSGTLGKDATVVDDNTKNFPGAPKAPAGVPLTDAGKLVFNTPANASGMYNPGGSNPITYSAADLGSASGSIQSPIVTGATGAGGSGTMSLQELLNWKPSGAPAAAPAPAPAPVRDSSQPLLPNPNAGANPAYKPPQFLQPGSPVSPGPLNFRELLKPPEKARADASNWNNV